MPKIVNNAVGEKCYKLDSGYKAPISLYKSLKEHIKLRLKTFKGRSSFTVRELCGEEYWLGITCNHMKRIGGMCFRTMVGDNDFDIEKAGMKSATKLYQFKK